MTRKISNNFLPTDRFVRTDEKFASNVAPHNRLRTDWIGTGKTFSELYEDNSFYRQNITRKNYSQDGMILISQNMVLKKLSNSKKILKVLISHMCSLLH